MNDRTTQTTQEEVSDQPPAAPNRIYLIVVWVIAAVACQWIADKLTWQLGFWPATFSAYALVGVPVYWAVYVRYQAFHALCDKASGKRERDANSAGTKIGLILLWVLVPFLPTQIPETE